MTVEQTAEGIMRWLEREAPAGLAIPAAGTAAWRERDRHPDFPAGSRAKLIAAAMHLREQGLVEIRVGEVKSSDWHGDRCVIGVRLAAED